MGLLFPPGLRINSIKLWNFWTARHTKATFFVLGWVAERNPRAIQKIVAAGHEIGCHSHSHQLVYSLDAAGIPP